MMGAQPGNCADVGSFTLPAHEGENLSDEQSAERMAENFALISRDFPPLDTDLLDKLQSTEKPPIVSDYDTYCKIKVA